MDEEKLKAIANVKATLETIEVRGKDNLNRMLGCIWTLEKLLVTEEKPNVSDHPEQ